MIKSSDISLKAFGDDLLRSMGEPVGYLSPNMTIRCKTGKQNSKMNLLGT